MNPLTPCMPLTSQPLATHHLPRGTSYPRCSAGGWLQVARCSVWCRAASLLAVCWQGLVQPTPLEPVEAGVHVGVAPARIAEAA